MADKIDAKKLVDQLVLDGAAIVVYPWPKRPDHKAGPFGIEYHQWEAGALRWFELGGSEGRHIHATKYTRAAAPHKFAVWLYDGERQVAYITALAEMYDGDELAQAEIQVARKNEAMEDPDTMERFLDFFTHG